MSEFMGEAIALGSPTAGRMSKRSRKAAEARLYKNLFGNGECLKPVLPTENNRDRLLRQAKELRELAARGMRPRAYIKRAEELEQQALRG